MSALERMLFNMLSQNMPPEMAQFMTPEGMEKLGNIVGQVFENFQTQQNQIATALTVVLQQQKEILDALAIKESGDVLSVTDASADEHRNDGNGDGTTVAGAGGGSDDANGTSRKRGGGKRGNSGANGDSASGSASG